ncbi:MAG: hypothetical protein WDZ62_00040 [Candidatus Pacearchaeota archaeon]
MTENKFDQYIEENEEKLFTLSNNGKEIKEILTNVSQSRSIPKVLDFPLFYVISKKDITKDELENQDKIRQSNALTIPSNYDSGGNRHNFENLLYIDYDENYSRKLTGRDFHKPLFFFHEKSKIKLRIKVNEFRVEKDPETNISKVSYNLSEHTNWGLPYTQYSKLNKTDLSKVDLNKISEIIDSGYIIGAGVKYNLNLEKIEYQIPKFFKDLQDSKGLEKIIKERWINPLMKFVK